MVQVHGDAWVGRIFDNEDDFKRLDFRLAELSSSAAWVATAAQQMRDKAKGEAPQAVLQRMEAERNAQAAAAPKAKVKELTAAEAAKVTLPVPVGLPDASRLPPPSMQLPSRARCQTWPMHCSVRSTGEHRSGCSGTERTLGAGGYPEG